MSLFAQPDKPARPGEDTAEAEAPWRLDALLSQQQRWWHEWIEAGNLWSSWWLSQLPAFGWPPVGQVLPPTPQESHASTRPPEGPAVHEVTVQEVANATQRTTRAGAARHH
jgi:hypothetical protein